MCRTSVELYALFVPKTKTVRTFDRKQKTYYIHLFLVNDIYHFRFRATLKLSNIETFVKMPQRKNNPKNNRKKNKRTKGQNGAAQIRNDLLKGQPKAESELKILGSRKNVDSWEHYMYSILEEKMTAMVLEDNGSDRTEIDRKLENYTEEMKKDPRAHFDAMLKTVAEEDQSLLLSVVRDWSEEDKRFIYAFSHQQIRDLLENLYEVAIKIPKLRNKIDFKTAEEVTMGFKKQLLRAMADQEDLCQLLANSIGIYRKGMDEELRAAYKATKRANKQERAKNPIQKCASCGCSKPVTELQKCSNCLL